MDIYLYNTLTSTKELFVPLKAGALSMYQCGPTVYNTAHIGNLRTYVFNDIVRRVFEYNGYTVSQVMNITDVDDKTIRASQLEKKSLTEITRHYEHLFLEDVAALSILTPTHIVRATEHIGSMISMISLLLEKGNAYTANDGVYFSIASSKQYGKLAKIKMDTETAEKSRERIANDEYDKESSHDFTLWKFYTPADGEVGWDAPFGKGRPGWHIECSAMSREALGDTFDIHTGGSDLIFPHHTNEIAQSEAATGKPFVHYWLHSGFMNVNDVKMAKSKSNFLKLSDLLNESVSPLAFRYWLLGAHYRTQLNFSFEAVKAAQTALMRLIAHFIELGSITGTINETYKKKFTTFINDDFDTPQALALVWELLKDKKIADADKRATLIDFDHILGLNLNTIDVEAALAEEAIPEDVTALSSAREEARKNKEWDKADALRKEIHARGYEVKDTENGPLILKF